MSAHPCQNKHQLAPRTKYRDWQKLQSQKGRIEERQKCRIECILYGAVSQPRIFKSFLNHIPEARLDPSKYNLKKVFFTTFLETTFPS